MSLMINVLLLFHLDLLSRLRNLLFSTMFYFDLVVCTADDDLPGSKDLQCLFGQLDPALTIEFCGVDLANDLFRYVTLDAAFGYQPNNSRPIHVPRLRGVTGNRVSPRVNYDQILCEVFTKHLRKHQPILIIDRVFTGAQHHWDIEFSSGHDRPHFPTLLHISPRGITLDPQSPTNTSNYHDFSGFIEFFLL